MSDDIEDLAIQNTALLFGGETTLIQKDSVINWIENQVFHLLNNDFNGLINILYRIDVYESKAKDCFGKQNKEIARCLALLIWERQLEKIKRRRSD
ncbi:MAG: hypothetical protein R2852_09580 [Bacteroidia bacterium]